MPLRIIVAAEHTGLVQTISAILRPFSLSCMVTLATTVTETVAQDLNILDPQLLILGASRSNARKVIRQARATRPRMRVLWLSEEADPLPEADVTLSQPLTPLRLAEAVSRAVK